jgi:hypothetical protein
MSVGTSTRLRLAIASDELRERHFCEIVILGRDPEHGHGFRLSLTQAAGEFQPLRALCRFV